MENLILLPIGIAVFGLYRLAVGFERHCRQDLELKVGDFAAIIAKAEAFQAAEGLDSVCFGHLVKAGRAAQEAGNMPLARRALHLCLVAVADAGGKRGREARKELAERIASLPDEPKN